MWLPTAIYEKFPHFWFVLGALIIILGLYLGFHFELVYLYLAIGVACCAFGLWIHRVRTRHRAATRRANASEETGDSQALQR